MAILLSGAAGFIGSHVARCLLARGETVIGIDNLNSYYDVSLKQARLSQLMGDEKFTFHKIDIANRQALKTLFAKTHIDRIVHLAAQAGVRYSIENPDVYVSSNLQGHANMLELARRNQIRHMVYASSSSVYGGNTKTPFSEDDLTDDPVSFYGATKKSNELLSNSYAHLYRVPLTGLRFFTVYGPWGRPDMAYWIFTEKITSGQPLRIFNKGDMGRDFTYIDDIVDGVIRALDHSPVITTDGVPHRVYNLGNDSPEELMTMVSMIEEKLGTAAVKVFEEMQKGDVKRTWADISRARKELGYDPKITLEQGLSNFIDWYVGTWEQAGRKTVSR
ncbi:GDP-mannose 4,6-dehydratase [Aquisalinus flavus]|uniref:NAD-dependent epimerase n=1 Tax=Aquisalinus flavus TaxID=1526572 RepID=A0A8J2Y719_9PROT|nr:GDP-mannose 4,6-dehydratase [Aquisalinus flavus]MBD0425267.1 GDP-mannose 4,6-dehydratase [Aquisalinus flavus]UNE49079.1 NAD-dependent epimerase/dehydratase family protein [Aquisalinus flavus]GGD17417.1 NAD-dependent epimerase [Aquisalinus flavus]